MPDGDTVAFTPDPPFPKSRGDSIRSGDWNNAISELIRLDAAKVQRSGDAISGSLTVAGSLAVGSAAPQARLEINSGAPDDGPIAAFTTPAAEDFISLFSGRRNNQQP